MNEQDADDGRSLFDFVPYILLVFRKRKLLAGGAVVICIAAVIYAFFIAKLEYLSTISFFPPVSSNISLPAGLPGLGVLSINSYELLDDQIVEVFETDALKRQIIEKFDLYKRYHLTKNKNKFVEAEARLDKHMHFETIEKGFMSYSKPLSFSISTYDHSSDTAFLMTEFAFFLLDSAMTRISTERAHLSRLFIESRLNDNKARLDSLQKAMQTFQEKTKMIDVPEQIKASFKTYADIKSMVIFNELRLQRLKNVYSASVPEMKMIEKNIDAYKEKLNQMEKDTTANPFPSFSKYRLLFPEYSNLTRDVEVQEYLVAYLTKELEQARVDEQKTTSNLIVFDPPRRAEYKARPKRLSLAGNIIFISFLMFFFALVGYEILAVQLKKGSKS